MSRLSEYWPGDREEKLGPPPWQPDDPKLVAWEQAHGHDVRLRCSMESCIVVEQRADRIEEAAQAVLDVWSNRGALTDLMHGPMKQLRAALNG